MSARVAAPPMLEADVRDARAWRRDALKPADWLVPLSPRCLDELDAVARAVREDPLPPLVLTPAPAVPAMYLAGSFNEDCQASSPLRVRANAPSGK